MTNWIYLINICIVSMSLAIAVIGLVASFLFREMDGFHRKLFKTLFFLQSACLSMDLISLLIINVESAAWTSYFFTLFMSIASALMMPILTIYLLHSCDEDFHKSALFYATVTLMSVYIFMLLSTLYSSAFFSVDFIGTYQRGPYYSLLFIPSGLVMILNLFGIIRRKEKLEPKRYKAFLIYIFAPLIGMLIQALFIGLYTIEFGSAIASATLFGFALLEQSEKQEKLRDDKSRQDLNIMLLQMRPHFIYNTLASIYYLVPQNPSRAQSAILSFTDYLRKNFASISKDAPIPFEEELEHVRAYLDVERIRFEDTLHVTFDTPVTDFVLPALSLQPIVENSVKYGVSPEKEPLMIVVRTERQYKTVIVTVSDNGGGFDQSKIKPGYSAIDLIRERLAYTCNGRLDINSIPWHGTTVRIILPNQ